VGCFYTGKTVQYILAPERDRGTADVWWPSSTLRENAPNACRCCAPVGRWRKSSRSRPKNPGHHGWTV